jgi:hypothetical protein
MQKPTETNDFSKTLEKWLKSERPKTIGGMLNVLDERSFALIFLVLMIFPAAPIPTGGITHVFEVIVALVALQLMIGRTTIWLPERFLKIKLNQATQEKVLPFLMRRIKFAEKFSRPRLSRMLEKKWFKAQLGFVVLVFTAAAFFAPPFTGLDTLPSLGVVFISIGIILGDFLIIGLGYIIGLVGVGAALLLGAGAITGLMQILK